MTNMGRAPLAPLPVNTQHMPMPGQTALMAKSFTAIRPASPIPGSKALDPGLYAFVQPAAVPQRSPSPVLRTVSLVNPHASVRSPSPTPGTTLLLVAAPGGLGSPRPLSPRPASPVLVFRLQQPQQEHPDGHLQQSFGATPSQVQVPAMPQLYASAAST
jgi:hypothetical protein